MRNDGILNEMVWLSYIIPLYNCGPYIRCCLDSILNQGLDACDYEVIVVDDGSTDNGPQWVEDYVKKYANFKLISQRNSGSGEARNRGFKEARGEYVYFIDADDWLIEGGMCILKNSFDHRNYDLIRFGWKYVDRYYVRQEDRLNEMQILYAGEMDDKGRNAYFSNMCWNILYRKKFLDKNSLKFSSLVMSDDTLFNCDAFAVEQISIVVTNLRLYRFRLRADSLTRCSNSLLAEKGLLAGLEFHRRIKQLHEEERISFDFYENRLRTIQWSSFAKILRSKFSYRKIKELFQMAKEKSFYPIEKPECRLHRMVNLFVQYPLLMYVCSVPFRMIYSYYGDVFNHQEGRMPTLKEYISSTVSCTCKC